MDRTTSSYSLPVSDSANADTALVTLDGNTIHARYGGCTISFNSDIAVDPGTAYGDLQAELQLAERAMHIALRRAKFVQGLRLARAVFTAQSARGSVTEADELLCAAGVDSHAYRDAQRLVEMILIGAGWERWTDADGRPQRASSDAVIVELRSGVHALGGNYGQPHFRWVDPVTHKDVNAVGEWWRVSLSPRDRDRVDEWELKLPFDAWKLRTAHNVAMLRDA